MSKMEALFAGRNYVGTYVKPLTRAEKVRIVGSDRSARWVSFEAMSLTDYSRKVGQGSYLSYLENKAKKAARA